MGFHETREPMDLAKSVVDQRGDSSSYADTAVPESRTQGLLISSPPECDQASPDKLVLIRSVLLMSFWYTDAQDHTGASHWIGIAITLAQGIGIHRCGNSSSFPENSSPTWRKIAQNGAREAASITNQTLEKMIELDIAKSIKLMFITSLIPAMQIHLFDCKSSSILQANLAKNRLNLCLLFLESLRDTYWSAGVMYRLFDRAQVILTNHNNNGNQNLNHRIRTAPPNTRNQAIGQEEDNGTTTEIKTPNLAPFMPNGPGAGVLGEEDITGGFDSHYSAEFNALEQLLGPGFALTDHQSQGLFTDFTGNGMEGELPLNLYNM
ncbi:hypothetical protein N7486_002618 [Penicillium sp. IBT 16267x]|nr:hypothetical protein N7486_002618 [Penicillium sp. IBT 16267x]